MNNDYSIYTTRDLLADYTGVRRELADVTSTIRSHKAELEEMEAQLALTVEGKNAEERKAKLTQALAQHGSTRKLRNNLLRLEERKEALEADVDVLSRYLRAREFSIRLRLVELLEARGHGSDGFQAVEDAVTDGMQYPF